MIKGGSSKWIHDELGLKKFAWQDVSQSQVNKTIAYINNQKEHHRKRTFKEEFLELLDKHGVAYDPRYIFR